jgi:hypothetical protein
MDLCKLRLHDLTENAVTQGQHYLPSGRADAGGPAPRRLAV